MRICRLHLAEQRGASGYTLVQRVEGEVERLESERSSLDARLAEPDLCHGKKTFTQAVKDFDTDEVELRSVMKCWEPAAERFGEVT